jgi:hypothetical protein
MGASRRPGERGVGLQAGIEKVTFLGMAKPSALYDEDFVLWTEEQADA